MAERLPRACPGPEGRFSPESSKVNKGSKADAAGVSQTGPGRVGTNRHERAFRGKLRGPGSCGAYKFGCTAGTKKSDNAGGNDWGDGIRISNRGVCFGKIWGWQPSRISSRAGGRSGAQRDAVQERGE